MELGEERERKESEFRLGNQWMKISIISLKISLNIEYSWRTKVAKNSFQNILSFAFS
jgi:hypothetical protein